MHRYGTNGDTQLSVVWKEIVVEEAHAIIETRPTFVTLECPVCHHDIRIDADEYFDMGPLFCGEENIECPECRATINIVSCEWDV